MGFRVRIAPEVEAESFALAVEAARYHRPLTDAMAKVVARTYETTGTQAYVLARLAEGDEVTVNEAIHAIAAARRKVVDPNGNRALASLADWVIDAAHLERELP